MEINTNSWHYKLIDLMQEVGPQPSNVCQYIRRVIKAMSLFVLLMAIVIFIAICLLTPIYVAITEDQFPYLAWETFLSMGIVLYVAVLVIIFYIWIKEAREAIFFNLPERKPSVFVQYIKDKHNKICTSIEYVRTED